MYFFFCVLLPLSRQVPESNGCSLRDRWVRQKCESDAVRSTEVMECKGKKQKQNMVFIRLYM